VVNPISGVDLRLMDVIGYDRILAEAPEPATGVLLVGALLVGGLIRRRGKSIA
jgi:hypothetical protein